MAGLKVASKFLNFGGFITQAAILVSKPARNPVHDWVLILQLVVGGIGLLLLLAVNLLYVLARQRTEFVNVAAARRLVNASQLIGVVLYVTTIYM